MEGRIQIDRFAVKNFRSIRECDVELAPLTFFIGANASGKTSFVDAIAFVASALRDSLEKAIEIRGGIHSILHYPINLPTSARFDFYLSSVMGSTYKFHLELQIVDGRSVSVTREECRIEYPKGEEHWYLVEGGTVRGSAAVFPAVSSDRIFLSNASGLPEFRLLFDFLAGIESSDPFGPLGAQVLELFGSGERSLATRFHNLGRSQPDRLEIIHQYLRVIAPSFDRIEVHESNNTLWLRFIDKSDWGSSVPFSISQTSAGLVSSAGILLELFEGPKTGKPASPVIIEEPEALLHPGAVQVIRDSFLEASRTRQVVVTTHSPDLLDDPAVPAEWIRMVYRDETGTHIDVLGTGTKSIIHDQLYTAGQLLRQGGLISK